MQRIANLLPAAKSAALCSLNTSFALISRLATCFQREKLHSLDSRFGSLSKIGAAAGAALFVALAPAAFAGGNMIKTVNVTQCNGSLLSQTNLNGNLCWSGTSSKNDFAAFSLAKMEAGIQVYPKPLNGMPTLVVLNDTGSTTVSLQLVGTIGKNDPISCQGSIGSAGCTISGPLGTVGPATSGGDNTVVYGPASTSSSWPAIVTITFYGVPLNGVVGLQWSSWSSTDESGVYLGGTVPNYGKPVNSCGGNPSTTTVKGTVYVPNGHDPLPNALIYIPYSAPGALTDGVQCLTNSTAVQGVAVTSTYSAVDGTFTLTGVPTGTDIPIVVQSGKWRVQRVIPTVTACANTDLAASLTSLPSNQYAGDIPMIALVTGAVDATECVLRKTGILDSEFTNPTGVGRINLYAGTGSPGARIDSSTPSESTLVASAAKLNTYDMVMLPCQGTPSDSTISSTTKANLLNWANLGGRLFTTHYSYAWLYDNPDTTSTSGFDAAATWHVDWDPPAPDPGMATVNMAFAGGSTLANWLQLNVIGGSTTLGQIQISTLRLDQAGVISPTQSWLTLNKNTTVPRSGPKEPAQPVMQMTFNTPVGASAANQCGRVLFNDYHVYNASGQGGITFPTECNTSAMTPQEHMLEYALFDLSNVVTPVVAGTVSQTFSNSPTPYFTQGDNADQITIAVTNTSLTISLDSSLEVTGTLPSGVTVNTSMFKSGDWTCATGGTPSGSTFDCTRTIALATNTLDAIYIPVAVASNAPTTPTSSLTDTIQGGGLATNVTGSDPLPIQGHPAITWATPAPITYGTALSGLQLNAAATCNGIAVSGTSVYNPAAGAILSAGNQTLNVTFTPSTVTSSCPVQTDSVVLVVTAGATTTKLSSSLNPSFAGSPVTFTANVAQGIGSSKPIGTVQFVVDGIPVGSAVTLSNGMASFTTSSLVAGMHSITATYLPAAGSSFLASSATPLVQVVSAFNSAVTLHLDSTQLVYPGQTNLTACVTSGSKPTATGTIGIYDGTKLLVTLTLQGNGCAYWYIAPGLSAGTHILTAKYSGDKNNPAGPSAPVTVTVGLAPITMEDACWNDSFPYGGNYQCNANMDSGTKTGYMTYVYDGGAPVKMPLDAAGAMQFILTLPPVGRHTLVIAYPQQGNFQGATLPVHTFTVTAAPVNVELTPSSWTPAFGASVTFTAKVTSSSGVAPKTTGSVLFSEGSTPLATVTVNASGQATYATKSLTSGTHTVKATYSGSASYGTGSGTATINVGAAPQTITFSGLPTTATYGASGPYTLKATASSGLGVTYNVTGPAAISGTTLTLTGAGSVTVTASQAGNNSFSAAKPITVTITVGKATTTTKLTAATTTPAAGSADLLTATVTGGNPTGSVIFMAGTTTICTSSIGAGGVATCNYTPSGSVTITATYQGGANNLTSSATLTLTCKAAAPATISVQYASTQLAFPGATNITACITSASHTAPTGTVGIYDGTTLLTTQTLQGNGCAYWYISPGLSAGNGSNGAVTSTATTLKVSPAPVSMSASWLSNYFSYGGDYTTTVRVTSNSNAGTPAGLITYSLDGAKAVPVTLSNGTATFTITKPAAGSHKLVIAYAQQTNYAAASSFTETFTVTAAPVRVTLTPSATSLAKGASVTFNAAVTSSNGLIPTGSVKFTEGSATLATVTVGTGGTAFFPTASLTTGIHNIKATYSGLPNFGGGSATAVVTVK